ncbi:PAS domain-containing protein [Ferruginibacter sp. SUN106]|uniref:sensor histidine kinase n=1 Tax=Ferruginibacter sp. SUN106 TaxID=2978348 RepID=UPI003D36C086
MKPTHIKKLQLQVKEKSDRQINYFLTAFFLIGLLLAFYYDTWLIAIGVGGLSLLAYYSAKLILPHSYLYQYVLGIVLGVFMAQFIYQMHGLFEMHFLAFIASAILITYRNWKLQIPLATVVILHHAAFGYLQFIGFDKIYFTQQEVMSLQVFIIHILLATAIFSLCGLWAYNFKKSGEHDAEQSFEVGKLQEANEQKEVLIVMSENLKRSNEKLKQVNDELEKIFNTVDEVLFSMDMVNYKIKHISIACIKVYGYTPDEFMKDRDLWLKLIHYHDKTFVGKIYEKLQAGNTVFNKYRIIHRDNNIRWVETKMIPTLDTRGRLIRIDGICNDITEKIKLEEKLATERKQQVQEITAAVIAAQEKERAFLGEELHDNINPILATARLYMDCAISREESRINLIKDSKNFITTAMDEIRTLSKTLAAPSLGDISLTGALADMISHIEHVNELEFSAKWACENESIISDNLKLAIYRIVQEQLNNILKHAHAKTVFITLQQTGGAIELNITDDGIGFDVTQKRNGVGLQNIINRSAIFNGKVNITSEPGQGCELTVQFNAATEEALTKNMARA